MTEFSHTRKEESQWPIFALLTGAFFLRLVTGLDQDLWDDEVASLIVAQTPLSQLRNYYLSDPHPPLFFTLLKPWTWISTGNVWLRLFPNLWGMVTIAVLYSWVNRAAGRKAALWAAALLALSPFHVWASTELRSHTLVAFLVTLAGYFCHRHLSGDGKIGWLILSVLCLSAAMWSHYYGIVAATAFTMTLAILSRREHRDVPIVLFTLIFLYLPWIYILDSQIDQAQSFRNIASIPDVIFSFAVMLGFSSFPWAPPRLLVLGDLAEISWTGYLAAMAVPAVILMSAVPLAMIRKQSRQASLLPGVFLLFTVAGTSLGSRLIDGFEIRYLVFLVPFLAMLAAVAFSSIQNGRLMLIFLVLCFLCADLNPWISAKFRRPDFSLLARTIEKDNGIVLIYNQNGAPGLMRAAGNRLEIHELREPFGTEIGDIDSRIAAIKPEQRPVCQVILNRELYDPTWRIDRALAARFGPPTCRLLESSLPVQVCRFSPD